MSDAEPDLYSTAYGRQHAPPDWSQDIVSPDDDGQRDSKPENVTRHGSEADYPYNPELRVEMQVGLDKLRCVPDRVTARHLYQLHVTLERKWNGPEAKKWRAEYERDRETAEHTRLAALSERAFKGELGEPAKQLAAHILYAQGYKTQRRTDLPALREFDIELKKLRNGR